MSDPGALNQPDRRRALIGVSVTVAVLAVVAAVIIAITKSGSNDTVDATLTPTQSASPTPTTHEQVPSGVTGVITTEKPAAEVANATGINGVVAYNTGDYPHNGGGSAGALPHDHVDGPVVYSVTPPVGGDHFGVWMNAGVYTAPVPSERAVHNMEHGAVWITYRPSLSVADLQTLQDFVGKQSMIDEGSNSNRYIVMSPWVSDDLPAPIVISSWGYQLQVSGPADPRLQQFVDTFRHSKKYTPEYGSAADGIPVGGQYEGGEPAMYGSKFANPRG